MTGETSRVLRLCLHHTWLLQRRNYSHPFSSLQTARSFSSASRGQRRGLLRKALAGICVAVPVAVGVKYAVSPPRERRKMRIVVEGFGRLFRSLSVGIFISVDYWWTTNVAVRGLHEGTPLITSTP